jgi:hypothetical protein
MRNDDNTVPKLGNQGYVFNQGMDQHALRPYAQASGLHNDGSCQKTVDNPALKS